MAAILPMLTSMAIDAGIIGSAVLAARVALFCHHFFKEVAK